jgi:hypothetical protein
MRSPGGRRGCLTAPPGKSNMSSMRQFADDDPGYLNWITSYPDRFVLNTYRRSTGLPDASSRELSDNPCQVKLDEGLSEGLRRTRRASSVRPRESRRRHPAVQSLLLSCCPPTNRSPVRGMCVRSSRGPHCIKIQVGPIAQWAITQRSRRQARWITARRPA